MGSYTILDIKKYTISSAGRYLFDANIWLLLLKPPSDLRPNEQAYIDFTNALIALIEKRKNEEKKHPVIIITSLILSEVFNAYMRMTFQTWKDEKIRNAIETTDHFKIQEAQRLEIKRDYRKSEAYSSNLKIFASDIQAYYENIELMDDNAKEIDPLDMIASFPANTDFNDYYYYLFARQHNLSIITNDGDFIFAGVEIITNHGSLLSLSE